MNPYDFVRIDWDRSPERRPPVWHHSLVGPQGQRLYTGHLDVDIEAETPLFIGDPRSNSPDPRKPAQSIKNNQGEYILPGNSLKGLLRNVVETLGNGCLTLFDGGYERGRVNYRREVAKEFQHCSQNTDLCIACRMFGMLKEGTHGIFLGKINLGDACAYSDKVYRYDPIYTLALMEPKPHHASFYLDADKQHISGRKYYFHHSPDKEPLSEKKLIPMRGNQSANRYIQPLDRGTQFHARIDFTNLEADEFAALLLAVTLEKDMRHKIGYGKPMGLGSIFIDPTYLKLVDYTARYTQPGNGITEKTGDDLWPFIDAQLDAFYDKSLVQIAIEDLRRIWRWPPDPNVDYYYPSKRDWFDTEDSIGKRIADTRNVP